MNGILDRVAGASPGVRYTNFKPTSQAEFFALRLAEKLGDVASTRHYAELLARYSEEQLLTAYRRARRGTPLPILPRSFHVELERLADRPGHNAPCHRLASIRIERRTIVVMLMKGDRLEYPPLARQLPSDAEKALGSAEAFLRRVLEKCRFERAALEVAPAKKDIQRATLSNHVENFLNQQGVSIWRVTKQELLRSFAYPAPRFRREVREITSDIWPGISDGFAGPLIEDALALGLYCHVESLFNLKS